MILHPQICSLPSLVRYGLVEPAETVRAAAAVLGKGYLLQDLRLLTTLPKVMGRGDVII